MTKLLAAALLLFCARPALAFDPGKTAADKPATPETGDESKDLYNDAKGAEAPVSGSGIHPHGWFTSGASLLYYDEKGDLAAEHPLVDEEQPEQSGNRVTTHSVIGGASPNARFGWTLERTTTWNQDRTKVYGSRRLLRVYGSEGKELWATSQADVPPNGVPLMFSADGTVLIVALRSDEGWTAQIKGWAGNTLYEVGPVPRIELMTLTRNGRYAMVRWNVPDQSATHTFVEVPTKTRQDIPSSELYLGLAKIGEDGKVYSGKRFVFDFAAAPKKGEIPGLPPKETPAPKQP